MLHTRLKSALTDGSSWAAIAALLGTLGSQVPAPFSYYAFTAAALGGAWAVLLKDKGAS